MILLSWLILTWILVSFVVLIFLGSPIALLIFLFSKFLELFGFSVEIKGDLAFYLFFIGQALSFIIANRILNRFVRKRYQSKRWWLAILSDDDVIAYGVLHGWYGLKYDFSFDKEKLDKLQKYAILDLSIYPSVKAIHKAYKAAKEGKLQNNFKGKTFALEEYQKAYVSICEERNLTPISFD